MTRPSARAGERGAVTVELALGLVGVVILLGFVLLLTTAATAQLRCTEGARAGARAAALGDDDAAVAALVRRVAGDDVRVGVERADGWVTVTAGRSVTGSWRIGALDVGAHLTAPVEP